MILTDHGAARVGIVALAQSHTHLFAGQPAAGEDHPPAPTADPLAALGDPVEREFQGLRPFHECSHKTMNDAITRRHCRWSVVGLRAAPIGL
jgi:hypothetical protein